MVTMQNGVYDKTYNVHNVTRAKQADVSREPRRRSRGLCRRPPGSPRGYGANASATTGTRGHVTELTDQQEK